MWGPWTDWLGGEPPVPAGTFVEAMVMGRGGVPPLPGLPPFSQLAFTVVDGDSFRLENFVRPDPSWLVYRYRVWTDVDRMSNLELLTMEQD